jgi:hypothetical protein
MQYLMSWREILDALELKNNPENQRRVRDANERFAGPIILRARAASPKSTRLSYWNGGTT